MQLTRKPVIAVLTVAAGLIVAGCNSESTPSATGAGGTGLAASTAQPVAAKPAPKPTCPLTGKVRAKGQRINRPAVAIKVDNVVGALPQSGVNGADVVVEEEVEGGLTRLMAIFQCNRVAVVGPIRSARISDADVLALLHGSVLGFSGANPKDLPPIRKDSDAALVSPSDAGSIFYRGTEHIAPHNEYSSTHAILRAGLHLRPHLHAPKPLFHYGAISTHARKAHTVAISWPSASASWTWSHGQWLRTQNGSIDRQTDGAQLSARNVVIMRVRLASTGLHDVLGNASPRDVTTGHNPVWVLRNGKMIKGTWSRPSIKDPLTLKDKSGHVIALAPGRTWIELLPAPDKPSRG
ncbi:MAG TPA: DUF3048 domain-containing protein [Mycobacteriales bacterium]|nr:DUF3048 domain-containing protein [Mycobacteriales bacterium]